MIIISATDTYAAPAPKVYSPVSRPHSVGEVALDFAFMYLVLWAGYAATQPDVVAKIQFKDFSKNVFERGAVLYDESGFYINFIGHPYVGSEYYLYFRSRGYAPKWAFLNCVITSTMFEIAVETFSEPFSTVDFVVTPLLGGPIGWWRECEGLRLVNSDNRFHRVLGRILYLETNVWFFEDAEFNPAISFKHGFAGFYFNAKF